VTNSQALAWNNTVQNFRFLALFNKNKNKSSLCPDIHGKIKACVFLHECSGLGLDSEGLLYFRENGTRINDIT
jgi:hypothetical protein